MVGFLIVAFIIAFILMVVGGIAYLLYAIAKKFGYPKVGIVIALIPTLFFLYVITYPFLADVIFSKSEARTILKDNGVVLQDDFVIEENVTMWSHVDYLHKFTLKLSHEDMQHVCMQIGTAQDFQRDKPKQDLLRLRLDEKGVKITQHYEISDAYVSEYYLSHGTGYRPTYRVVKVSKTDSTLSFRESTE